MTDTTPTMSNNDMAAHLTAINRDGLVAAVDVTQKYIADMRAIIEKLPQAEGYTSPTGSVLSSMIAQLGMSINTQLPQMLSSLSPAPSLVTAPVIYP